jgi:1,4-alpha-glucan branching enzyme
MNYIYNVMMPTTPLHSFIEQDEQLKPFSKIIRQRIDYALRTESRITGNTALEDFATGHLFYGWHKDSENYIFREHAPNATAIFLVGDFSGWKELSEFLLSPIGNGNWEGRFPIALLHHKQSYKLLVKWNGGEGYRIPSYALRAVQNSETNVFNAQLWFPEHPYKWKNQRPDFYKMPPIIYEAHIGMSSVDPKVSTYSEFRQNVLPRIQKTGYNTIQLMAIQEHPYYGSFGYHVSNFYAASSRFGEPEELKALIDEAHGMGLRVIMDLVHSHSVKNTEEGLGLFDGTPFLYFHNGIRRNHAAWDSLCFDYSKTETLHFLLSNCRFWLDEYQFDGFRFDGVTSMIYLDHGLGKDFTNYGLYFDNNQDLDALSYLYLANKLIHKAVQNAVTIAEEVSAMPGLATPQSLEGWGFDYRLSMGTPDLWIKLLKDVPYEKWDMGHLFYELNSHRVEEKTIGYAESHDQAIVGDKTIIFRLLDKEMYTSMSKFTPNMHVDSSLALHRIIRLITFATAGGGYLTFMGNEFGHPEWIDFPREGNEWSYHYARRQWNLSDDTTLRYHQLGDFDRQMLSLLGNANFFEQDYANRTHCDEANQILAFERSGFTFVFNFSPVKSFDAYKIPIAPGKYELILSSDSSVFGGFDRITEKVYFSVADNDYTSLKTNYLSLSLPTQVGLVFKKQETRSIYDL